MPGAYVVGNASVRPLTGLGGKNAVRITPGRTCAEAGGGEEK